MNPDPISLPGSRDRLGRATAALRQMQARVLEVLVDASYEEVCPPTLDSLEAFAREVEGSALVTDGGRVLSLRTDFTGPVARIAGLQLRDWSGPLRLSYRGPVFRSGAREVQQAGAELFGVRGPEGEAEVIRLALDALDALGVRGRVVLGSVAVVDALAPPTPALRQALDWRDRQRMMALPEVRILPPQQRVGLAALLDLAGGPEVLDEARAVLPGCEEALGRLGAVLAGLGDADVLVDLAHVRTPTYYTGVVFDIYADGAPRELAGGGRYDTLAARFGPDRPAVGVSLDLDALLALTVRGEAC